MGRRHFLTRLALGRSAFQEPEETPSAQNEVETPQANDAPRRTYDARGRAVSERTDLRNAEMRRAQNSILALVGVVEEREQQAVRAELDEFEIKARSRRYVEVLEREHEKGEDLDDALTAVQHVLHWLPMMVSARYQAGLYDPRRPLLAEITRLFRIRLGSGSQGLVSSLMPGAVAYFVHTLTGVVLTNLIESVINLLQKSLIARGKGRKHTKTLYTLIDSLWSAALLGVDLALLPLEFYAITQMLGIRPALPLLPSWKLLLPWTPSSVHSYIWKSPISTPILRSFCSPASLLLLLRMVYEDSDPSSGIPICSLLTSFRYPDMLENSTELRVQKSDHPTQCPIFARDPLGWILYRGWTWRCRFMQACNWTIPTHGNRSARDTELVQVERTSQDAVPARRFRSTHLALLPSKRLATSIDVMFQTLLVIPLHSLAYRSVATAYLDAATPIHGSSTLYQAAGGPISDAIRSGGTLQSLNHLGSYVSKIGLSLAMHTIVDISVVGLAYYAARRYGTRGYDWKKRDPVQKRSITQEDSST